MTKLSECVSFPKKKEDRYYNEHGVIFYKNTEEIKGYNQALNECKDAVDKMELDVVALENIIYHEARTEHLKTSIEKHLVKAIADNLPKLLKEKA